VATPTVERLTSTGPAFEAIPERLILQAGLLAAANLLDEEADPDLSTVMAP